MPHDTVIVGGGPAGLTAAIHLAWHHRDVIVVDRVTGPLFFTLERLQNVPGMPDCRGVDIQKQLQQHAADLGAEIVKGDVKRAQDVEGNFMLAGKNGKTWNARTVLLATGVARYHPTVDGDYKPCFAYAGKGNMFYCPDCEAPEIKDRDTLVIAAGSGNSGAGMAIGLSRYTSKLRVLLTNDDQLDSKRAGQLAEKNIEVLRGRIKRLEGRKGILSAIVLEDDTTVPAEAFFVSSPAYGRTDLAQQLGVEMATTGNHAQPKSQRGDTNIPGVWIAGDLRPMTQQIAVAMGTGNVAAVMIDQYLRKQEVR